MLTANPPHSSPLPSHSYRSSSGRSYGQHRPHWQRRRRLQRMPSSCFATAGVRENRYRNGGPAVDEHASSTMKLRAARRWPNRAGARVTRRGHIPSHPNLLAIRRCTFRFYTLASKWYMFSRKLTCTRSISRNVYIHSGRPCGSVLWSWKAAHRQDRSGPRPAHRQDRVYRKLGLTVPDKDGSV